MQCSGSCSQRYVGGQKGELPTVHGDRVPAGCGEHMVISVWEPHCLRTIGIDGQMQGTQ